MPLKPNEVVGLNLYADGNVNLYRDTFGFAPAFATIKKGDLIGKVASWVSKNANELYWEFDDSAGNVYYAKQSGNINVDLAQSDIQDIKDAENPQTYMQQAGKIIGGAMVSYGVFKIAAALISRK